MYVIHLDRKVCRFYLFVVSCLVNNIIFYPGELPVARSAALKHILRSMHRMMQSSGTAEGLRGLIDLSLLKSIKKIIEHRGIFGPSVLPLGMYICLKLATSH